MITYLKNLGKTTSYIMVVGVLVLLMMMHTPDTAQASNQIQTAKVTANSLNVRSTPSMKGKVVDVLDKGYGVRVLSINKHGWVQIAKGKYVYKSHLASDDGQYIGYKISKTTNQPMPVNNKGYGKITQGERELLARLVRAEAGGEAFIGQVAVAQVVMNRVKSHRFPSTIKGVIYQPRQFSPVMNGSISRSANKVNYQAVDYALTNSDVTQGALFFYAPSLVRSPYMESLKHVKVIGVHHFKTFK